MIASFEHSPEFVTSFDGTEIAAHKIGDTGARPLLLISAIGANLTPWRRTAREIVASRPVVSWDLRGLYDSGPPASNRLDVGTHAEDAVAVLDHFGIDSFAVAAWSSGTRIALELAARYPDRMSSLALVCGGYGHPLRRVLRAEVTSLLPMLAGAARPFSGLIERAVRGLVSRPEISGLVRQSGMIAPTADVPALVDMIQSAASCDLRTVL